MPLHIINRSEIDVTDEQHDLVVKFAKKCVRTLNKKEYELPDLYSKSLIVFTKPAIRACGGVDRAADCGVIKIGMAPLNSQKRSMREYESIAECKVLGNFIGSPEMVLKAVIAHEIAHFVQRTHCGDDPKMWKNHGEGWRRLYCWLRRELINPYVSEVGIPTEELREGLLQSKPTPPPLGVSHPY